MTQQTPPTSPFASIPIPPFLLLSLAILLLLLLLLLIYLYKTLYHNPLSSIPPAHWSAPYSRAWILWVRFSRRENEILKEVHGRLRSSVIRVAPWEVSVCGLEGVRGVYSSRDGGWGKGGWYGVFDNFGVPCMFSSRSSADHSARKRLLSHVYSKSYIQSSSAARAQAAEIIYKRLLPALEAEGGISRDGEPTEGVGVDIYSVFMAATMDFIAAYIFGLDGGTEFLRDKAYRNHFFELYKARNDYGIYDQELPWLTAFCRRIGVPLCPAWVDDANKELGEWCLRLCRAKRDRDSGSEKAGRKPGDESVVWDAVVNGLEKEETVNGRNSVLYPTALANKELSVASELFDHVLAGQETAGLVLTYLSWRLSLSLELQGKLRTELLGLRPGMRLSETGMPDPKQLDGLPLLHAVLMETLRLHAPIPGAQPRQSPEAGSRIGPYEIPGGVRVAAMAYTLHRDETVFPDPERWDYTRWLAEYATEEEIKTRNRQFWAFSSGGRMCVGSNFAMHEMKLIIAALYSNFRSYIVDDEGVARQSDGYTGRPEKERLYLRFEVV
ncbi:hypothetical protein QBC47DRAFT_293287 [Echria macrotheca]|uniref:Cytochrome P450 n=1 Tax=Echria macrotheca TaxID=438768 RepID=A0AAJ0BK25_9PEZI|nr:hypothetical protein QBC47DRAFT_293287 [Echria macrotheca]